ncbi:MULTISPECIES: hypothetical protein [Leptospira]|uniref:hypothetical protein n=1 Tax=Leptospira TaxID=171 RepID=UPI0002BFA885|nr:MULTISPECIES: hypothetical protein [Leptospira]EMJ65965.1 hypothetical protein LEP1GSC051_0230 [Leptospira sp. P2653]
MRFRLTMICLLKTAAFLLVFFCMPQERFEYTDDVQYDLTKALQNPLKVRVLDLSRQELALKEKEIIRKLFPNAGLIFEYH